MSYGFKPLWTVAKAIGKLSVLVEAAIDLAPAPAI